MKDQYSRETLVVGASGQARRPKSPTRCDRYSVMSARDCAAGIPQLHAGGHTFSILLIHVLGLLLPQ